MTPIPKDILIGHVIPSLSVEDIYALCRVNKIMRQIIQKAASFPIKDFHPFNLTTRSILLNENIANFLRYKIKMNILSYYPAKELLDAWEMVRPLDPIECSRIPNDQKWKLLNWAPRPSKLSETPSTKEIFNHVMLTGTKNLGLPFSVEDLVLPILAQDLLDDTIPLDDLCHLLRFALLKALKDHELGRDNHMILRLLLAHPKAHEIPANTITEALECLPNPWRLSTNQEQLELFCSPILMMLSLPNAVNLNQDRYKDRDSEILLRNCPEKPFDIMTQTVGCVLEKTVETNNLEDLSWLLSLPWTKQVLANRTIALSILNKPLDIAHKKNNSEIITLFNSICQSQNEV